MNDEPWTPVPPGNYRTKLIGLTSENMTMLEIVDGVHVGKKLFMPTRQLSFIPILVKVDIVEDEDTIRNTVELA